MLSPQEGTLGGGGPVINKVLGRLHRLPGGAVIKNLPANAREARNAGSIPGLGIPPAEGNDNPLQYSCLGNPMDRGGWWAIIHRVT